MDGLIGGHGDLVLRYVNLYSLFIFKFALSLDCLRTVSSSPTTRARSAATSTSSWITETSNSSRNSWRTTQAGCSRTRRQGSASINGFREELECFQIFTSFRLSSDLYVLYVFCIEKSNIFVDPSGSRKGQRPRLPRRRPAFHRVRLRQIQTYRGRGCEKLIRNQSRKVIAKG